MLARRFTVVAIEPPLAHSPQRELLDWRAPFPIQRLPQMMRGLRSKKASRYGKLDEGYVVAISCLAAGLLSGLSLPVMGAAAR